MTTRASLPEYLQTLRNPNDATFGGTGGANGIEVADEWIPVVYRLYVEGGIGAGKSTFCDWLAENWPGLVEKLTENVSGWQEMPILDGHGVPTGETYNHLEKTYDDVGFRPMGQIGFLVSAAKTERAAVERAMSKSVKCGEPVLLIIERSLKAGPAFVRVSSEHFSKEEMTMYQQYYQLVADGIEGIPNAPVVGTLYLVTTVLKCFARMISRGRPEEIDAVTIEYATRVNAEMDTQFSEAYQFDVTGDNDRPKEFYEPACTWITESIASLAN